MRHGRAQFFPREWKRASEQSTKPTSANGLNIRSIPQKESAQIARMNLSKRNLEAGAEATAVADAPRLPPLDATEIGSLITTQYSGLIDLVRRKLRDRELAADLVN